MKNTTLCYLLRGDDVLLLHRVKKENDLNHDKWIGIGGKFEEGESPEECLIREAWEERDSPSRAISTEGLSPLYPMSGRESTCTFTPPPAGRVS